MREARAIDVVITGIGAVSPYGLGAERLWSALRAGQSGIRPLVHAYADRLKVKVAAQVPPETDLSAGVAPDRIGLLDRAALFAVIAAQEAVEQSGLDFSAPALGLRSGAIIGTGVGGETTHDDQNRRLYAENASRLHPLTIPRLMINAAASHVSMAHGLKGPSFAVASACASANHAIAQACLQIRSGLADVVVTGGTDACLTFGSLRAWEAMRVLAEDDCRPFSATRRGLVLAEGAGIFVLESREHAQRRNARVLGVIAGFGMSADAGDVVAPDPEGAARAMQAALADAGVAPWEVDYLNAHGTGTVANDLSETKAIRLVFAEHADRLAVSSTKSMHGHAIGAAGALELVAVLGALRDNVVPPTINLESPDPHCDLDYVAGIARSRQVEVALSNSFAFGGLNAVLAVRRN
jgi:nodulation protein E